MRNNANDIFRNLTAVRTWLTDAQTWIKLAEQLNSESSPELSVARSCTALAFQLTYKWLLVSEGKWPKENDGIERTHQRLTIGKQIQIERWLADAGFYDTRNLLWTLDANMPPSYDTFGIELRVGQLRPETDISQLVEIYPNLLNLAKQCLKDIENSRQHNECKLELDIDSVLDSVIEKIQEIVKKSKGGDYIYRGERECYDKICSSLYRHYEREIDAKMFKIETAHNEMLKVAKGYTQEGDDFSVLSELHHYGANTNLMAFTTDYLIALYFACDGSHHEDGRFVLLRESNAIVDGYGIKKPLIPQNYAIVQKSVFVCPPNGFIDFDIDPSDIINIPKHLKRAFLKYLRIHHQIYAKTMYNDLHGFIKYREFHEIAYVEFLKGSKFFRKSEHGKAIWHYNEALFENSQLPEVYINLGVAYGMKGDHDRAIEEFDVAIQLDRNSAEAYYNRGIAYRRAGDSYRGIKDLERSLQLRPGWSDACFNLGLSLLHNKDWARARCYLKTAKDNGVKIAMQFRLEEIGISEFELKIDEELPDEIVALLQPSQKPNQKTC